MDQMAWLNQVVEEIVEPEREICDPHHHLWDHPQSRYLLDELLADTGGGHNVVSTVFVECSSMYRALGPEALRPVGETEFVNGVAAMSASGGFGEMRACSGIVSYANLCLGGRASPAPGVCSLDSVTAIRSSLLRCSTVPCADRIARTRRLGRSGHVTNLVRMAGGFQRRAPIGAPLG